MFSLFTARENVLHKIASKAAAHQNKKSPSRVLPQNSTKSARFPSPHKNAPTNK